MAFFLNEARIREIREIIQQERPGSSSPERARAFASRIHEEIDVRLDLLGESEKNKLKKQLIRHAVKKQSFVISHDEFRALSKELVDPAEVETLLSPPGTVQEEENPGHASQGFSKSLYLMAGGAASLIMVALLAAGYDGEDPNATAGEGHLQVPATQSLSVEEAEPIERVDNELPADMQYQDVPTEELRLWLDERQSKLASEERLSTIIQTAGDFNIHPYVIVAIAGQEQSFVPRDHPYADEIINNPYNVFHSWRDYNTDLQDATEIVSRTITTLSADRPEGMDVFEWMNRKYAEHDEWWIGVRQIYDQLHNEMDERG
ncbi:hypothetical protein [Salisediminibacterium selenitireducens]|uniref:Uncharacterized protein n=1 Tax=Bacillus selenitireducens (strain ATCC 700615 / DSM 15326 / MLS10) TaxID=439292 RepID=D6XYH7_BACIE|nr:hypothetical protein [Salisediminibacterium selenitireducens]ADI00246.1 hypothetical protein Bsel_2749 [[Bacillus] selenitireducens MLS10]